MHQCAKRKRLHLTTLRRRALDPAPPLPCPDAGALASMERQRVLRVLDAAANRASEGLRVAEDYVRFVLDDPFLTEELKRLRHDLAEALSRVPMSARLSARETLGDVGTCIALPAERRRRSAAHVLTANLTRSQEVLRSLEEFGKTVDGDMAARLERLRYRCYTLQRAAETTRASLERMEGARLYVLLDGLREYARVRDVGPSNRRGRRRRSATARQIPRRPPLAGTSPDVAEDRCAGQDAVPSERPARSGRSRPGRRRSPGPGGTDGEGRERS